MPNSEKHPQEDQHRILAAIWLLGHFGQLGARSNLGWGNVSLLSWELSEGWPDKECQQVSETTDKQAEKIQAGLKPIKSWFQGELKGDRSC